MSGLTPNSVIAVAMSGGVDSSAVAAILHAHGHSIVGLTLQLWNQRRLAGHGNVPDAAPASGRCCSIADVYDARRVAEQLGIPYYLVNQQERFERDVIQPFVADYLVGRTPIPCTLCNNHLKFDQLLLTARSIGATHVATGHYARNRFSEDTGRWILSRPADRSKDQTYFLFGLTQDQLAHTLFPLGESTKPHVRSLAQQAGLSVATKPDSQEICFIPGGDYSEFLSAYLEEQGRPQPDTAGEIRSSTGVLLGEHTGIHQFTVGQRKGLGIASPTPLYVLEIDPVNHQVTVGSDEALLSRELVVDRVNWISKSAIEQPTRALIKIRHRHEPAAATLHADSEGRVHAQFDQPQRAITPGQAAVFYQDDDVLGGGWILSARPAATSPQGTQAEVSVP